MATPTETISIAEVKDFPRERTLLPSEMAVGIGCRGCASTVARCYVVTADRPNREALRADLMTASELTGIPVALMLGSRVITSPTAEADTPCTSGACQDPDNVELFNFMAV